MKNLKYIFFIVILLFIFSFAMFFKFKKGSNSKNTVENQEIHQEAELENQEKFGKSREEIVKLALDFVDKNIISLSPDKAVLGGSWFVNRFWVVEEVDKANKVQLYTEYEDGHIMRKLLAEIEVEENIGYAILAIFEPGEADWNIMQGNDIAFGKQLLLYEKDEIGEWLKR
ncbi:MAG: hypothetical protein V1891_01000 [bacterium]